MRLSDLMRPAAFASLLSLALCAPVLAQSSSTSKMPGLQLSGDEPIQIESDKLEVHENESVAIFTGNVNVVQGPTLLKAGRMKVYYIKDDKAGSGVASAGSATTGTANIDRLEINDKIYIKSDTQVATGDSGTFDMKSQVLVLSGKKVVLSDGDNVLTGCKLTVQMETGLAQVDACGGRVKMSIVPGSQKP